MRIFELYEDELNYYIVSELLNGGELYERIITIKHFRERDAADLIHQLLLGVNYMHQKNIIHRDLKPENILIQNKSAEKVFLKITDFGFAKFYDPEKDKGMKETLGSPLYMAPEIINKEPYGEKVDVWAVGVILYILLCGKPPFSGKSKEKIFENVLSSPIIFTGKHW